MIRFEKTNLISLSVFPIVLLLTIMLWQTELFAQTPDITTIEYFLDSNPGFGNGTSVPFTADSIIDENFSIDLSTTSLGFHKLFIRVKDTDGSWSLTDMRDIFKIRQPDSPPPTKDIVAFEYFFDTDPGFGNGTSLSVTSGLDIDEDYVIDITLLSLGFHEILFRIKDSDGIWSLTDKRDIFKMRQPDSPPPTKDVVAFEYFFDTDPGFGNGTSLPVTSGLDIDEDYVIDITSLSLGFHEILFRVQDSDGIWSLTDKRDIFKMRQPDSPPPTKDVVAFEYFFDTDPGFGNGTSLPVTSGLDIDENYVIDITSLSLGFHEILFRVQDSDGIWSLTDKRDIFKLRAPDSPPPTKDVVACEYFFDTDPGFGNGTALTVTPGLAISESYSIDITGLILGFHTIFFRVQDSDGLWSLTDKRDIFKMEITDPRPPAPNIVAMEYFIDTDPGFGNGTPVTVPASTNIDENFLIDVSGLITGNHILFVRVQDENGKWSLTHIEEYCHPPVADFMADNVWFGDSTTFTDLSQNTDEFTQYYWDVDGDDVTDYTYDNGFRHKYGAAGSYDARLILLTPEGCSDTIVKEVSVFTCSQPTALSVSDTTNNSAILHWTPANIETEWNIEYGLSGFTLGTGTLISSIFTNSYELTGLGQNTTYDFYVRSACPESTFSSWAGPQTFTTLEGGACENPTDGGTIADSQTICNGTVPDPFTSVSPATGYSGNLEYKWQLSADNLVFTDIPASNSEGLVYSDPITDTTWFKRLARVDCMSDWTGAAESNTIEIMIEQIDKYRTKASGDWDDPAVWEYFNGTLWVDAPNYPSTTFTTCLNPVASIQYGDTINIDTNIEFGNVDVDQGGVLEIQDGAELGIVASDTLTVDGK
ncbi:MAG: hypothetical protein K8S16_04845 [Bacteroidales bacterium]|nr:hypothetical protein [Bacteroidales bacterium]